MTLAQQMSLLISRIGTEFKEHNTRVAGNTSGDISTLSTTAKGSIVVAINEVQALAAQNAVDIDSAEARLTAVESDIANIDHTVLINDTTAASSTTFSSTKIVAELDKLKAEILGDESLPTALDTLSEIAAYVQNNKDLIDSLNTLAGDRVATTANQGLTAEEQTNALTNLGIESHGAAITSLEGDMVTVQSDIVALQDFLDTPETGLVAQVDAIKADIVGLTSRVEALEADTTAADLTALTARVSANETNHSQLVADLGDVSADLVALFEASLL